jgi:hypothetical protein
MASSAAELTTVLANLVPVGASWRVLCSYKSGLEGGGVEVGCPAVVRRPARGAFHGGPYEVQWKAWRCPAPVHPNSVRDGVTVPGVAPQ